jgi:hypothetical protein
MERLLPTRKPKDGGLAPDRGVSENGRVPHTTAEHWKDDPDAHDYPAASDFLTLIMTDPEATDLVNRLTKAVIMHRKAKDILRASNLALLGRDNKHVAADLAKVSHGERLSPVLLVRGRFDLASPLIVADGYHRVCASYWIDENAEIPCKLV